MSYVTHVFRTYFGYPKAEAERLMLLVHNEGRAVVATGPREEMERHTEAMHEYGLWATVVRRVIRLQLSPTELELLQTLLAQYEELVQVDERRPGARAAVPDRLPR